MDRHGIPLHDSLDDDLTGAATGHHEGEPSLSSFSTTAIRHGRHPANLARMKDPDLHASRFGWCGEVMEMYLRVEGERVTEAKFWADGCLSTMACADILTTMARGMTLKEVAAITPEELIAALGGLPYKSHHCAELSVETVRAAIDALERG